MKNINIETNWVRVMGNTRNPSEKEMNEMIGQELEVYESNYYSNTIYVYNKDKSDYYYFKKSDVRFLTPAMFNGNHIAIDDDVFVSKEWRKVLGFSMYDSKVVILAGNPKPTLNYTMSEIQDHRTKTPETPETKMTIAQIEEKLNITGLKIIE